MSGPKRVLSVLCTVFVVSVSWAAAGDEASQQTAVMVSNAFCMFMSVVG